MKCVRGMIYTIVECEGEGNHFNIRLVWMLNILSLCVLKDFGYQMKAKLFKFLADEVG